MQNMWTALRLFIMRLYNVFFPMPEGYEKTFHGTRYELYDVGKVDVIEWHGKIKGKGLLVFFPDKPRLKKDIRNQ